MGPISCWRRWSRRWCRVWLLRSLPFGLRSWAVSIDGFFRGRFAAGDKGGEAVGSARRRSGRRSQCAAGRSRALAAARSASSASVQPREPSSFGWFRACTVGARHDIVQRAGIVRVHFRRASRRDIRHRRGAPGERKQRGDERRGDARAADRAPMGHVQDVCFFVFAFGLGVVDGDPVCGSASAETSATARCAPQPTDDQSERSRCHGWARECARCSHRRRRPGHSTPSRSASAGARALSRVPPTATTWGRRRGSRW